MVKTISKNGRREPFLRDKVYICGTCFCEFKTSKSCKSRTPLYCSRSCYGLSIAKWKKCLACNKDYYNWNNNTFCSRKCRGVFQRGKPLSDSHKKALSIAHKGIFKFDKSPSWKGDEVGYVGLHEWVYKILESPMRCSDCGVKKENNHQIHWCNVSGEYRRDISDWIRLCVSCHRKFDLGRDKRAKEIFPNYSRRVSDLLCKK